MVLAGINLSLIRMGQAKTRLTAEQKTRLFSQVIDGVSSGARVLIITGGLIWLAMYARDALIALAGKRTDASVLLNLVASIQIDRWVAYIFGVGGVTYGVAERKLRQRNIRRLTPELIAEEHRMDVGRTSSDLMPDGRSRKGD